MGDIVGRDVLPSAVVLNGMGFNVTRSVAPAIGGAIVAAAGALFAFAINAGELPWSHRRGLALEWRSSRGSGPARIAAFRYLRRSSLYVGLSPHLTRVMFRGFVFGLTTIIVLALMPLIGRELLGGGPVLYRRSALCLWCRGGKAEGWRLRNCENA